MKWIKVTGTYGGSIYSRGKVFEVNSETDTGFPDRNASFESAQIRTQTPEIDLETIGDRYVIERRTYSEPRPTSAFHYVYVVCYFRAKKD